MTKQERTRQHCRYLICLAAIALLLGASTAQAATVMMVSQVEMARRAQRIIHGKVESVRSFWRNNRIVTEALVRVKEPIKGAETGQLLPVSWPGGTVGKLSATTSGMPDLKTGDEAVLYLEMVQGRNLPLGRNLGIYKVRFDQATGRLLARRDISQLALMANPNTGLDPAAVPRIRELPLPQLLREIRGHISQAAQLKGR